MSIFKLNSNIISWITVNLFVSGSIQRSCVGGEERERERLSFVIKIWLYATVQLWDLARQSLWVFCPLVSDTGAWRSRIRLQERKMIESGRAKTDWNPRIWVGTHKGRLRLMPVLITSDLDYIATLQKKGPLVKELNKHKWSRGHISRRRLQEKVGSLGPSAASHQHCELVNR